MSVIPAPPVSAPERASRARIPLTRPAGLIGSLLTRYAVRQYGQLPDNLSAFWHNRKVLFGYLRFERGVASWNALDPQLRILAEMAAAKDIECTWCLDFGFYAAHAQGLDTAKLAAVGSWRASELFTPTERRVIEYAEAMTATPPTVTDELVAALRADLGDAALVELTMMVGVENIRSRFNTALGLASQGFSESCRVP